MEGESLVLGSVKINNRVIHSDSLGDLLAE